MKRSTKTKSVVTLGTFDGIHRGHRRILERVVARAKTWKARSVALAFAMPPRHSRPGGVEEVLLTTLEEKVAILRRLGVDAIKILRFTPALARREPEEFFKDVIVRHLNATEMVVGPRVAFGRRRRGKLGLLRRLGRRAGVQISVVPPILQNGEAIASRRIRQAVRTGRVDEAAKLLGYPYSVAAQVIHGSRRGRTLGFPTANLKIPKRKLLPRGVFLVKVLRAAKAPVDPTPRELRRAVDGLCNVGTRPTFNGTTLHCEVFLFGRPGSLYGKSLRVFFIKKRRAEKKFRSSQDLVRQINSDFVWAKRLAGAR